MPPKQNSFSKSKPTIKGNLSRLNLLNLIKVLHNVESNPPHTRPISRPSSSAKSSATSSVPRPSSSAKSSATSPVPRPSSSAKSSSTLPVPRPLTKSSSSSLVRRRNSAGAGGNVLNANNHITNILINRPEKNLPNKTATQCYKNSTLHLLLSIIRNELSNKPTNIDNDAIFEMLFINRNNRNGTKNNLKSVLKDMLLGKVISYDRIINTYFPSTISIPAPPQFPVEPVKEPNMSEKNYGKKYKNYQNNLKSYPQRLKNYKARQFTRINGIIRPKLRSEHYHDNNEYLNSIFSDNIFNEGLVNRIFNICSENRFINMINNVMNPIMLHNNNGTELTMNDFLVNNEITEDLINNLIKNTYILKNAIEVRFGERYIYDYIIINCDLGNELTHNMNLDLNTIFNINNNMYIINDISYYGETHYVSINRRGNDFYYYNDLDRNINGMPCYEDEINTGICRDGRLPKTIMLKRI